MSWKDDIIDQYRAIQKTQAETATWMVICSFLSAIMVLVVNGISDWLMCLGCLGLGVFFIHRRKKHWKNYHASVGIPIDQSLGDTST